MAALKAQSAEILEQGRVVAPSSNSLQPLRVIGDVWKSETAAANDDTIETAYQVPAGFRILGYRVHSDVAAAKVELGFDKDATTSAGTANAAAAQKQIAEPTTSSKVASSDDLNILVLRDANLKFKVKSGTPKELNIYIVGVLLGA